MYCFQYRFDSCQCFYSVFLLVGIYLINLSLRIHFQIFFILFENCFSSQWCITRLCCYVKPIWSFLSNEKAKTTPTPRPPQGASLRSCSHRAVAGSLPGARWGALGSLPTVGFLRSGGHYHIMPRTLRGDGITKLPPHTCGKTCFEKNLAWGKNVLESQLHI